MLHPTQEFRMFFIVSKIVSMVIYPVPFLLLLLLAVLLWYRRRHVRLVLVGVIVLFYGLSTPIVAARLAQWLEIPRLPPQQLQPHYDVAIVLAGMLNGRLSSPQRLEFNNAVERILTGIDLVKRGMADKLLISGKTGDLFGRGNEAELLRGFAIEWGLTPEQVVLEAQSRNTYENAAYSAQIIRASGYNTLILVTSALHMRRAAAAFHKQGLFPELYPVDFHVDREITPSSFLPSVDVLAVTTWAIHELIGLAMYRLQGYI
jgi:uncharacterized SAM-binding protein YcdF (DUF218 family)